jgi:pimeloyl-ACP methyl ester carboxylesterase
VVRCHYQQASYKRLAALELKWAIRQALGRGARVDFHWPHVPLLFLLGYDDRIMPARLNRANFRRHTHVVFVTDYCELPGRSHALLG